MADFPATLETVRMAFDAHGVSIRAWAEARDFEPATVYGVLNGRLRGRRGQAHAIAIALGLKPDPKMQANPNTKRIFEAAPN